MALIWFFIFAAAGGALWYCETKMTISQRRKIIFNFVTILFILSVASFFYELITTGSVSFPPGPD